MKIIGIAFLCVLFFWFVVWLGGGFSARNEPPKQPDQAYQTTDTPKKYLAPLNTALTLGFNRLGTFIHDFREEIVAIGTLFIAAFTIILAFATAFLYGATRDLVRGAKETTERQLRAYVSIDGTSARLLFDSNGEPILVERGEKIIEGYVRLKNFGQTPGRDFKSWVKIKIAEDAPFNEVSEGLGRGIISPQGEANMPVHWMVSDVDLAAIRNETKRIFVWGAAEYVDIFGRDRFFKFYRRNAKEYPPGCWALEQADKPEEAN